MRTMVLQPEKSRVPQDNSKPVYHETEQMVFEFPMSPSVNACHMCSTFAPLATKLRRSDQVWKGTDHPPSLWQAAESAPLLPYS